MNRPHRHASLLIGFVLLTTYGLTRIVDAQCVEGCVAIHTLVGETPGDQFGWVSNDLGDIDGDTVHDFILTAPTADYAGTNSGRIYVYSGATGDELFRETGAASFFWLGHDGACAGDVNADGVPDVMAGAPNSGAGRVYVYSGTSRGLGDVVHIFGGEVNGDQFGFRIYGGGDFDGDTITDLIIGAPAHDSAGNDAGRAYVYSGDDFSLICCMDGAQPGARFGSGVTFIGDVTGDGRDDVAVGAMNDGPFAGGLGYVYSYDGASYSLEYMLDPGPIAQDFGQWFMNGGHDVNNDGTPDIYVNDFNVNRAHIFSGVDGSSLCVLTGDGNGGFGIGRLLPDIDGDNYADMILAAWASSAGAFQAGKAFVYSGMDCATSPVLETFTHNVVSANFGFDANGMGDINGDGMYDYLITAASDLGQTGVAYVIAGNIGPGTPADLDGDGVVGPADLAQLLGNWGPCGKGDCPADFNGDGQVGPADLAQLLGAWG